MFGILGEEVVVGDEVFVFGCFIVVFFIIFVGYIGIYMGGIGGEGEVCGIKWGGWGSGCFLILGCFIGLRMFK